LFQKKKWIFTSEIILFSFLSTIFTFSNEKRKYFISLIEDIEKGKSYLEDFSTTKIQSNRIKEDFYADKNINLTYNLAVQEKDHVDDNSKKVIDTTDPFFMDQKEKNNKRMISYGNKKEEIGYKYSSYERKEFNESNSFFFIRKKIYDMNLEGGFVHKNEGEKKLIIPTISFFMRQQPFLKEKNPFFSTLIMDFHIFAYNSINYHPIFSDTGIRTGINTSINIENIFPVSTCFTIHPKMNYKGFFDTLDCGSNILLFQTIETSTDLLFTKEFLKLKRSSLFNNIESMLSFGIIYRTSSIEKRINIVLNNNCKIENNLEKKKILDFFQIKTSYIFDDKSFKWKNFHFIGSTDLFTNCLKYQGGLNFYEEEEEMYFNFHFKHQMNPFHKKKKYRKKGKNCYEEFFFEQDNYVMFPIPLDIKIDLSYKNSFNQEELLKKSFLLRINGFIAKYWNMEMQMEYNLFQHRMDLFKISFYRNLRNLKMNFNWYPIGGVDHRYWSFFIGENES